jgi:hypothetical protein
MNPYANLYLKVADQHRRDLAREYRRAQRGWADPGSADAGYVPVRRHRVRAALGRLRANGGNRPAATTRSVEPGLQRAHVA